MSHPTRPQAQGPARRRRRDLKIEAVQPLEQRALLAPYLVTGPITATFTAATTPTNANLGTVTVTSGLGSSTASSSTYPSAAPTTSVAMLTPASSFGGDIVRIAAGPGGVFGNAIYAVDRGAGENTNAANHPGVIYRIDPATGKASVFFDLNTVINQLEPGGNAGNSVGASTGLVNWYDITFDPEGTFNGTPSMFISSVDREDPNKNIIYQINSQGALIGTFVSMTDGLSSLKFTMNPSAILVPPVQDQSFLRGLIAGTGTGSSAAAAAAGTSFAALYFNANAYSPGQNISSSTLPTGVTQTGLDLGPQVGLTAANQDYLSSVYSAYTDFGTPSSTSGGIPARPGVSGVQGLNGEDLIGLVATSTTSLTPDQTPEVSTNFRRFEDIAFDQYGYFSQGFPLTTSTSTSSSSGTSGSSTTTLQSLGSPVSAGNLFVADLATGLAVTVTPVGSSTGVVVPIQGPGSIGVTQGSSTGAFQPIVSNGNTTGGSNIGGRILRITPQGVVTVFAAGFATSGAIDSTSFIDSSLSISFSADGTVLYASDDQGIWQFKATTDLADSTTGSLIGLSDLRTLGVPYDGNGSAIDIVDTGVDATSPPFRGRVAAGTNVVTGGLGNSDTAAVSTSTGSTGGTSGTGGTGGSGSTGGNSSGNSITAVSVDGHGTLVAGVVAQFVPQATLNPINVFYPFLQLATTTIGGGTSSGSGTGGSGSGGNTGGNGNTGNNGGSSITASSNALTTTNAVYQGTVYAAQHPYVNDPVRPNKVDRVIAAVYGFGSTETFNTEGNAYRRYPQIAIAFKNQLKKFRALGITSIAASGQFGAPFASGSSSNSSGSSGSSGSSSGGTSTGATGTNNANNTNDGDVNGMAFPAILNEMVSVTGTIPFPYVQTPSTAPTDPTIGTVQTNINNTPATIFEEGIAVGGIQLSTSTSTSTGTTTSNANPITQLTAGNLAVYSDTLLASANRGPTTDYAAPAIDVPTFRRRFTSASVATTTSTGGTSSSSSSLTGDSLDPNDHLTFVQGGTSLSAAIVGGSFAMVSSALNYWSNLNSTGVTSDAYLTTPVQALQLNYGKGALKDLSMYNTPDGINAILQWTAVPVTDANNQLSTADPPYLTGSSQFRSYSRIDVGNAISAIEGTIAIQYLLQHNDFPLIDENHDGSITAQELQDFVDNAPKTGLYEAASMARLLGGTARIPGNSTTLFGQSPDQPDVLQRRFNFFDAAADGQLNGSITITQYKQLAHTLLPSPTAFVITNRQKSANAGYLVDPSATRNYHDLLHLKANYALVPKSALVKYRNISPARFKVNRLVGTDSILSQFPIYTLFSGSRVTQTSSQGTVAPTTIKTSSSAPTVTTGTGTGSTSPTTPSTGGTTTGTGTTTTGTGSGSTTTGTGTNSATATAQGLIDYAKQLAGGSSSSTGTVTTAGTLTADTTSTSSTSSGTTTTASTGSTSSSSTGNNSSSTTQNSLPSVFPTGTSTTGTSTTPTTTASTPPAQSDPTKKTS